MSVLLGEGTGDVARGQDDEDVGLQTITSASRNVSAIAIAQDSSEIGLMNQALGVEQHEAAEA